jgi:hypothetical protein
MELMIELSYSSRTDFKGHEIKVYKENNNIIFFYNDVQQEDNRLAMSLLLNYFLDLDGWNNSRYLDTKEYNNEEVSTKILNILSDKIKHKEEEIIKLKNIINILQNI